jgi:transcriptional regulator with XRE-family HTH domain
MRRVSQQRLAKAIGIAQSGVSAMEAGTRMPSLEQVMAIAKVLRVNVSKLCYNPNKEEPVPCESDKLLAILSPKKAKPS